ncbi:hypothetical protein DMN91_004642, partial [Ooceraea biroi]
EGHISPNCPKRGANTKTTSHLIEKDREAESEEGASSTTTIHVSDMRVLDKDRACIEKSKTDKELRQYIEKLVAIDKTLEQERNELRDTAKLVNRAVHEYNKIQYDKRHKKPTKYSEGDFVLIKVLQHKPGTNQKLVSKYKGPYQIKRVLKKNRFVVTAIPGYNLTQRPLNTILSADKIKPWIKIADVASSEPNETL